MAKAVEPKDWLDHHSGRLAQDHVIRLICSSSCALPSDQALQELVEEQLKADLLALAFHGRRLMERHNLKSASVTKDALWPSSIFDSSTSNLWDVFGLIIHAHSVEVGWEKADMLPNPHKGREPVFAGSVRVKSEKGSAVIPIGGIASAFFGQVLKQLPSETVN